LGHARHRAEASARRGSRLVTGDGTRYSHGAPVVLPQHSRGCRCSTEARSPGYSSVRAQWWLGSSEWSEPWLPAPSGLGSLWTPRLAASFSQSALPICCDQALMQGAAQPCMRSRVSRRPRVSLLVCVAVLVATPPTGYNLLCNLRRRAATLRHSCS
jgi:hypothetical protein